AAQQSVLARDHRRAVDLSYARDLGEWYLCATGRVHQQPAQRFRARSKLLCVTHSRGEPPSPFDRDGEICLTDAGVDDVLDRRYVDAVARGGLPVDLDVDVRLAGERFR